MNRYIATLALGLMALGAGAQTADRFDATTLTLDAAYIEQEYTGPSSAQYLVTLKDDGNGPQFKAGSSAIVVTKPASHIVKVSVSWGSKSNEGVAVYTQSFPYSTSTSAPTGELLGTIPFEANTTAEYTFAETDRVEYLALTSTAVKGKAAAFTSITIEWAGDAAPEADPMEGLRINEVCGDDATTDGHEDWIEIFNPTASAIDLSGAYLVKTDENGYSETLCTVADGTVLTPGAYFVAEKGTDFTAGISNNKNLIITLYSPAGTRIDMFNKQKELTHNGHHSAGLSYSYFADQTPHWQVMPATKGAENAIVELPAPEHASYVPVTAATLTSGLQVAVVNLQYGFAMVPDWDTTSDGGVYLYGRPCFEPATEADALTMPANLDFVTLNDCGDGTWTLYFGETENYLNDSRYMACTAFKNIDFKKKDDPAKGTRATIAINAAGDAEISFGEAAGSIKFNYKGDDTSRFFNYDPADKPEDHLMIHLYTKGATDGITAAATEADGPVEYYTVQGVRVLNPGSGIYVVRQGRSARLQLLK